jgi:hypothetical protein
MPILLYPQNFYSPQSQDGKTYPGGTPRDCIPLFGFGSNHPGICQFVLGDGAVRPLSVTIGFGTLANLAEVNSTNPVGSF